jgi:HK97 family phage prohead protease
VTTEIRGKRIARELEGTFERRNFTSPDLELREVNSGALRFRGYATTFGDRYEVGDFSEEIVAGALRRCLAESPDVCLLVNHGGTPLARTKSGTLTLLEDAHGLNVVAELEPDDPDVEAILPKVRRGDIDEMSLAFRATRSEWNEDYTERTIRELTVHRGDVSLVNMGANPNTSLSVRKRAISVPRSLVVPSYVEQARAAKARAERDAA